MWLSSPRFSPQVGQPFGDKSISPFSLKVEVFMRMAGIAYTTIPPSISIIAKNRKRKLPVMWTGEGDFVSDSTFIINHLMEEAPYREICAESILDGKLSSNERALGVALQAMCEESLYFVIGYWRYVFESGFATYCQVNPTIAEMGVRWFERPAQWYARRAITKQLWAQGIARHSEKEVGLIGNSYLEALDAFLGDGSDEFLFGSKPSTYDACVYAFLSAILEIRLACPLQEYAQSKPKLVDYVRRVSRRY